MRRFALLGAAIVLAGAPLAGCTKATDQPGAPASPGDQPSVSPASSTPTAPAPSSAAAQPSAPASTPLAGATATATATDALLDWKPVPGNPANTVTTDGAHTLTVGQQGDWWSLTGPGLSGGRTRAPAGFQVATALLGSGWAVVVYQDPDGAKQERAVITALASGTTHTLDRTSDLPPSTDGSWALDGTTLWHATDHAGAYCLASTDLASMSSTLGWCAPPRHGFTNVLAADGTTSMMTFDDSQPSCRTVVTVEGTRTTPYPGVTACKGAEGVVLGADSRVWSIVPDEHRYQQVHVYATTAAGVTDLGPGVNSTLTRCGGSAYWARDAGSGSPGALMRWDGAQLTVAYRAKGFLSQPQCADGHLTLVDSSDSGDRQLSAAAG